MLSFHTAAAACACRGLAAEVLPSRDSTLWATGWLWSWEEPSFQLAVRSWGSLEGSGEGERGNRDSRSGGRFSSTETSRQGSQAGVRGGNENQREKLSPLVLKTLGELKGTAWSQTLGKAAEKRMPDRRVCEEMVKEHSYPYK